MMKSLVLNRSVLAQKWISQCLANLLISFPALEPALIICYLR
jgi:hypothetical protein